MIENTIEQILKLFEKKGYSFHLKSETDGGEWAGPCPYCREGEDRFLLWFYKGNCWCRKCRKGGPIKYVLIHKLRYPSDEIQPIFQELESYRDSNAKSNVSNQPSPEWIRCITEVTYAGARVLWLQENKSILDYLRHQRYLEDETIQRFLLGFSPAKQLYYQLFIPEGILIPELHNSKASNIRVRLTINGRPVESIDKYATISWNKGSNYQQLCKGSPDCFGLDSISRKEFLFLCEGEFDCMLLWQEAHDLVDVITLGSCARNIPDQLMPLLKSYKKVFVCYDNDEGGKAGAKKVLSRLDTAKLVAVMGKDITDAYKGGQNLRKLVDYTVKNCV